MLGPGAAQGGSVVQLICGTEALNIRLMLPAGREALAAPWVWGQANSVLSVLLVMLVALESCVCGWCPAKCRGVGQQGGACGWLLQLSKDAKYGFGIFFFSMNMPPTLLLCLLWEGSPCGPVGHRRSQPALGTLLPC